MILKVHAWIAFDYSNVTKIAIQGKEGKEEKRWEIDCIKKKKGKKALDFIEIGGSKLAQRILKGSWNTLEQT